MTGFPFRRLLFMALALIALTLFALDLAVKRHLANREAVAGEERVRSLSWLLSEQLKSSPETGLEAWVQSAAANTHTRVTLIDPNGSVVADSMGDQSVLENLGRRPDVIEAVLGRTGIFSDDSANPPGLSLAAPVSARNGRPLILRLTTAVSDPESVRLRIWILSLALGSAGLALGIAYKISRSLSLRVTRLRQVAAGILSSAPTNRAATDYFGDDLGSLERSLAGVAQELRSLLDRLRFESARREAILSSMTEGVLAVDHDLRVTFCNAAFLRAVGVRGTQYEGHSLLEIIRDPELNRVLRSVLNTGESDKFRLKLSTEHPRTFEVQSIPLTMPSGPGAIAILHDTTDIERLEQVRKDFVANVSHELRTPLAGIIGYAETLLDGALQDEANNHRFIEIIRSNAIRLNSIAADLLVLSELESGNEPPDPEAISVLEVVDAALLTLESEARLRQVRLIRDRVEGIFVAGSRLRLEQVLLNLIANATKFNHAGGEVHISAAQVDGRVAITVSDTGVGIPYQDLPRIFERFYRVDKVRSKQVGGTGLGLSIVKHAVERMNGSVTVESQLGRGSTFTLWLPVAVPAERSQS